MFWGSIVKYAAGCKPFKEQDVQAEQNQACASGCTRVNFMRRPWLKLLFLKFRDLPFWQLCFIWNPCRWKLTPLTLISWMPQRYLASHKCPQVVHPYQSATHDNKFIFSLMQPIIVISTADPIIPTAADVVRISMTHSVNACNSNDQKILSWLSLPTVTVLVGHLVKTSSRLRLAYHSCLRQTSNKVAIISQCCAEGVFGSSAATVVYPLMHRAGRCYHRTWQAAGKITSRSYAGQTPCRRWRAWLPGWSMHCMCHAFSRYCIPRQQVGLLLVIHMLLRPH